MKKRLSKKSKAIPQDNAVDAILVILDQISDMPRSTLPKIWRSLNRWEWAEELGDKPKDWDAMSFEERSVWIRPINEYIAGLVGEKGLLRYCHKIDFGVTDMEFDDWWDSRCGRLSEEKYEELRDSYDCRHYRNNNSGNVNFIYGALAILAFGVTALFFLFFFVSR